ncbi:MAG: metallophosphoesterase family protein [bacterium]
MKHILFSDIHGNLEALHAALGFMESLPDARIYSLGDIVGYGANPKECIAEVQRVAHESLAGNHDHAAVGLTSIEYFNTFARKAVMWTADALDENERAYLANLPLSVNIPNTMFLVHATPILPGAWHYIMSMDDARENFTAFDEPVCFLGHSHSPIGIGIGPKGAITVHEESPLHLKKGCRYIINVGSIGQPRDGDWRACLVVYDDDARCVEFIRLEYDCTGAQEKILQAGLPEFLAQRLQYGR